MPPQGIKVLNAKFNIKLLKIVLILSTNDFTMITNILCLYLRNFLSVETTMRDHSIIIINFNTEVMESKCCMKLAKKVIVQSTLVLWYNLK